jgi:hypothetical protein
MFDLAGRLIRATVVVVSVLIGFSVAVVGVVTRGVAVRRLGAGARMDVGQIHRSRLRQTLDVKFDLDPAGRVREGGNPVHAGAWLGCRPLRFELL